MVAPIEGCVSFSTSRVDKDREQQELGGLEVLVTAPGLDAVPQDGSRDSPLSQIVPSNILIDLLHLCPESEKTDVPSSLIEVWSELTGRRRVCVGLVFQPPPSEIIWFCLSAEPCVRLSLITSSRRVLLAVFSLGLLSSPDLSTPEIHPPALLCGSEFRAEPRVPTPASLFGMQMRQRR